MGHTKRIRKAHMKLRQRRRKLREAARYLPVAPRSCIDVGMWELTKRAIDRQLAGATLTTDDLACAFEEVAVHAGADRDEVLALREARREAFHRRSEEP
jgi:hypothetical protein